MIKFTNRIELEDGYYIIRIEYFKCGWGVRGQELLYSLNDELINTRGYGNQEKDYEKEGYDESR